MSGQRHALLLHPLSPWLWGHGYVQLPEAEATLPGVCLVAMWLLLPGCCLAVMWLLLPGWCLAVMWLLLLMCAFAAAAPPWLWSLDTELLEMMVALRQSAAWADPTLMLDHPQPHLQVGCVLDGRRIHCALSCKP